MSTRTPHSCAPRPNRLRRILPTLALACLTAPGLTLPAHATAGTAPAHARQQIQPGAPQAAASFPTWGTRWVVHATPDINSPSVGMINQNSAGQDRITADYQVNTGHRVCEGSACSTFMAHITSPVTGFLTVVAVDIPEDRLPGVPVQDAPGPQTGARHQTLQRAAAWLTANGGRPVPYSQSARWRDGYRQDCSGYASMALGLPAPGTTTVGLATNRGLTRPIAMSELQPGDLVIDALGDNNTRHVVIFERWNDAARRSYMAYEQRSGPGTTHRSLTYGLNAGSEYKAYRPVQYGD
jgi:hypothetical protein